MIPRLLCLLLLIFGLLACSRENDNGQLGLKLEPGSQREIAYTDKGDAFWVTRTGGYNNSPWHGLTASKRQYVEDLFISANGYLLDREAARVMVDPNHLQREYAAEGIRETWTILDNQRGLMVKLESETAIRWAIQPAVLSGSQPEDFKVTTSESGMRIQLLTHQDQKSAYQYVHLLFSQPMKWLLPSALDLQRFNGYLTQQAQSDPAREMLIQVYVSNEPVFVATDPATVLNQRQQRIETLLDKAAMQSNRPDLDQAMVWAQASLDALIMDQMGVGIYAGLPWFDDYWGRDVFISFAGATLISGKFETAKAILRSFAELQNRDPDDKNYGRVPNRAQPEDIIYNTTDGTPWFIRSIWDAYRYSGDEAFLSEMWGSVRIATEGALQNWVDENGLLRHDDADTWMDAKGPDGPWSPRGDRAIEIQFIWRDQLEICQILALKFHDESLAERCAIALLKLEDGLDLFRSIEHGTLVDHLNKDDSQDQQIRPNTFLVPPLFHETCDWKTFAFLAPQLVSPRGVLSLTQDDPNFHPFHQRPGLYVKDAAYHNGIIWTWNSAAAIPAFVQFGQMHYAEAILNDLSDQILNRGAVGTLAELTDAWPQEGVLSLSGTFSQAWSLAEYLRSFYQDILGVQPDLSSQTICLKPRLIAGIEDVRFFHPVGDDTWQLSYLETDDSFQIDIQRKSPSGLTLEIELLQGDLMPSIQFLWSTQSLHLRYEKRMGQWTVPAGVGEYHQRTRDFEFPLNQLPFCNIDTTLDVPVLRGPEHRLLTESEIVVKEGTMGNTISLLKDASGDDRGDGNSYVYPGNSQFQPGIVDILSLEIGENEESYTFELKFANLVDPGWHPEYGYQLTYCALGISYDEHSGTASIGKNAQAEFKNGFKADQILYLSGGFQLAGADHQIQAEYMPTTASGAIGNAETETIRFKLPLELLKGNLAQARVQVAVGFQDDHGGAGLGDLRAVEKQGSEWNGGGRRGPEDSNIYDWLLQ